MTIIWLLVGLGLIVLGADSLVEGASSIARKAGVSEFVIGLTIVGFGTSCPELVVSLTGALEGNADVAVGNVLGSNIFNVLFILGLTALVRPVSMTPENRKKDIPVTLVVTVLFLVLGMNRTVLSIGDADGLSRVPPISLPPSEAEKPIRIPRKPRSNGVSGFRSSWLPSAWADSFSAETFSWIPPPRWRVNWA